MFINWVERVQGEGLPLEWMGVVEGVGRQVVECGGGGACGVNGDGGGGWEASC